MYALNFFYMLFLIIIFPLFSMEEGIVQPAKKPKTGNVKNQTISSLRNTAMQTYIKGLRADLQANCNLEYCNILYALDKIKDLKNKMPIDLLEEYQKQFVTEIILPTILSLIGRQGFKQTASYLTDPAFKEYKINETINGYLKNMKDDQLREIILNLMSESKLLKKIELPLSKYKVIQNQIYIPKYDILIFSDRCTLYIYYVKDKPRLIFQQAFKIDYRSRDLHIAVDNDTIVAGIQDELYYFKITPSNPIPQVKQSTIKTFNDKKDNPLDIFNIALTPYYLILVTSQKERYYDYRVQLSIQPRNTDNQTILSSKIVKIKKSKGLLENNTYYVLSPLKDMLMYYIEPELGVILLNQDPPIISKNQIMSEKEQRGVLQSINEQNVLQLMDTKKARLLFFEECSKLSHYSVVELLTWVIIDTNIFMNVSNTIYACTIFSPINHEYKRIVDLYSRLFGFLKRAQSNGFINQISLEEK